MQTAPDIVDSVISRCPLLRSLIILEGSNVQFSDALLQRIATRCPFLEAIRISDGFALRETGIKALGQAGRLRALQIEVLEHGNLLDPTYYTALGDIFPLNPHLHTLTTPANPTLMHRIATHAPQLQHLAVSFIRLPMHSYLGLREGLGEVVCSCTQLRTLWVTRQVEDAILIALGAHCPHLVALAAMYGFNSTDAGLCALARGCRQLRELSTVPYPSYFLPTPHLRAPVSMVGIAALATHCPHLRELDVDRSVVPAATPANQDTFVVGRLRVTVL
jgi:hypothetical protein